MRKLTKKMQGVLNDVLECQSVNGKINYLLLSKKWNVPSTTTAGRVHRLRGMGYDVPSFQRMSLAEKEELVSMDEKYFRPRSFDREYGTEFVQIEEMGDVSLPVCENCKKRGRVGKRGAIVHLSFYDGAMYCMACGWSPSDDVYQDGVIEIGKSLSIMRNGSIFKWNEVSYAR